jgi:hypothetical protein
MQPQRVMCHYTIGSKTKRYLHKIVTLCRLISYKLDSAIVGTSYVVGILPKLQWNHGLQQDKQCPSAYRAIALSAARQHSKHMRRIRQSMYPSTARHAIALSLLKPRLASTKTTLQRIKNPEQTLSLLLLHLFQLPTVSLRCYQRNLMSARQYPTLNPVAIPRQRTPHA